MGVAVLTAVDVMTILVVVSGPAQGSGVRSASVALTAVLKSLGHSVDTLAIDTKQRSTGNRLNAENVRSTMRDVADVVRAVRHERPDLVWFHSLGFPSLPGLRTLAVVLGVRLSRVPVICHLHAYGLDEPALASHRWSRLIIGAFGRASEKVVTLHESSARAISSVVSGDRVAVLPNIVDVPPEPSPLPLGHRCRLVFVGGLVRRKGIPELLGAMRLLDDSYELHLVGGRGEDGHEATARLIESAADLVASGRVVFEGEMDDAGVRDQLRLADLFVLPSHAEGTPISLLEAMAEGRPVLVSDAGDMASIVSTARCGLVLSSVDPRAVASGIHDLLDGQQRASAMGRRAHAYVRHSHSPDAARAALATYLGDRVGGS